MNNNNLYQKRLKIKELENELESLRADKRIEQLQKEVDFLKYKEDLHKFSLRYPAITSDTIFDSQGNIVKKPSLFDEIHKDLLKGSCFNKTL